MNIVGIIIRPKTYEGPHCKNGDNPCGAPTFFCSTLEEFLCSGMCNEGKFILE